MLNGVTAGATSPKTQDISNTFQNSIQDYFASSPFSEQNGSIIECSDEDLL